VACRSVFGATRCVTQCRKAQVPHRLLHDCRRTAARNLIRAGVPERIAMLLTGHKTRAVFDRYNIVNEQELLTAGQRLAAYLEVNSSTPIRWDHRSSKPGVAGSSPAGRAKLARICEFEMRPQNSASFAPLTATGRNLPTEILFAVSGAILSGVGGFSSPSLRFQSSADRCHRRNRWPNTPRTCGQLGLS